MTKRYSISSAFLKHTACLSMFIDHFCAVVLWACWEWLIVSGAPAGTTDAAGEIYSLGRAVGRIAFILFAFMASEGFQYTHSRKKYLLRLLAFAVISEIPFDLAIEGAFFTMKGQNVYWTLFLGVAALCLLEKLRGRPPLQFLGVFLCCIAAFLLHTDYMFMGVCLIVVFYLCRKSFWPRFAAASVVIYTGTVFSYVVNYWGSGIGWSVYLQASTQELYGLLAFGLIYFYNGKKGKQLPKAFYYWFYPLHLLFLYGIRLYLFPAVTP
ncbi:MAG: conjugal transfer protein TraX [Blautia sp.]|nr:conjugal transfer protein TraX [Blautia sp.]MCM1200132.1 conjugal transfer protein TraX [Bacteroides fragilis]